MGCFSFYANKIITTGEGGMVVRLGCGTGERLPPLRNLAFRRDRRFLHTEIGHNYRLTNLQAAVGVAQIERIDTHIEKKRWMASRPIRGTSDRSPASGFRRAADWAKNVYWMYGVVLDDRHRFNPVGFAQRLRERGVDTRPFFLGMHEQPALHKLGLFHNERYPIAERLARQGLYLPSGLALTDEQVETVGDAVREALHA